MQGPHVTEVPSPPPTALLATGGRETTGTLFHHAFSSLAVAMVTSNKFCAKVLDVVGIVYVLADPFDMGGRFVCLHVNFKVIILFILLFYDGGVAGSQRQPQNNLFY